MASELLERTAALRDEAWEAVKASKPYAVFKALDEATMVAGGTSALAIPAPARVVKVLKKRKAPLPFHRPSAGTPRVPHADAAEDALREAGKPMMISSLMDAAIAKGAQIGGEHPVNNFRSTLSKDERFVSVQRGEKFFWWFKGEALPSTKNEAAELAFSEGSAAS